MRVCKLLFLLVSGFASSLSVAQALPQIEWQHTTAPRGDGTRAYLFGEIVLPGPFPTTYYVSQPAFDARKVIATADGAFLVVPINAGGESENLRYLLAPHWLSNRGWQVIKLGPGGQLLWSRSFLGHRPESPVPLAANSGFGGYGDFTDIRATASGGLALLSSGNLTVYSATGEVASSILFDSICRVSGENFPSPSQAFLTDEDVLVVGFGLNSSTNASRACALDFAGVELERIEATIGYLQVGDYRRQFGFLVHDGNWNQGQWSNSSLSLRSSTTVRWSKAVNDYGYMNGGRFLSPGGETWIVCGIDFCKYELDGDLGFAIPQAQQDETDALAWLADGSLLLASHHSLRVRVADGSSRWQVEYGSAWSDANGVNWQVLGDRVRSGRYYASLDSGRVFSIALADGQLLDDDVIALDDQESHQAFGLFGTGDSIALVQGTPSTTWYRPFELPCDLPGYCPYQAEFAKPVARVYANNTAAVAEVGAAAFEFPLSALPLERRSFPRLTFEGENYSGVLSLVYVHDGVRNRARLERLSRTGVLEWSRDFGFDRYDTTEASLYDNGTAIFVSATEAGPYVGAPVAKMWKFNRATGAQEWVIGLPFPLQQIRQLRTEPNVLDICGISRDAPYRLGCASVAGVLTRNVEISSVPANRRLRAEPGSSLFLRARVLPFDTDIVDRAEYVRITPLALLQPERTLSFEPVAPGQRLRIDAVHTSGLIFATALLYPNASALNRPIAMLVGSFDTLGNRLWQRRIDIEQRGLFDRIENTSIVQPDGDEIYVSMHPYTAPGTTTFRTSVCTLNAAGDLVGCTDSPREGRIVSLFQHWDGTSIWVWQRGYIDAAKTKLGMYLYSFDALGFSPALAAVETHQALAPDSYNYDNENAYFQLVSNGTGSGRGGADTQLVAIKLREEPILANGFED